MVSNGVPSNPFVSLETLKACALIGLHLLAAEDEAGSCGSQSLDLGDMWREVCTKSPEWISSCSARETFHGGEVYEHNNECQDIVERSGGAVSRGLGAWEGSFELPHDHGPLCQEMRDACWDSSESLGSPLSLCSQCQEGSLTEE